MQPFVQVLLRFRVRVEILVVVIEVQAGGGMLVCAHFQAQLTGRNFLQHREREHIMRHTLVCIVRSHMHVEVKAPFADHEMKRASARNITAVLGAVLV